MLSAVYAKSAPARPHHLVQIHSKAQPNDGCLQKKRGELFGVEVIGVRERQTVD